MKNLKPRLRTRKFLTPDRQKGLLTLFKSAFDKSTEKSVDYVIYLGTARMRPRATTLHAIWERMGV